MSEPTTEELIERWRAVVAPLRPGKYGHCSEYTDLPVDVADEAAKAGDDLASRLETLESALAAERKKSSDLIAAWPTYGACGVSVVRQNDGGNWVYLDADGYHGPYPTREAAVMAHVASLAGKEVK